MILPDVNVLVYAFRQDAPYHAVCRRWLDNVVHSDTRFGLSRLVLSAVVRVSTSSRIYATPSSPQEAFGFCQDFLSQPHAEMVEPRERHWEIFKRLCFQTGTRGSKVSDVYFAALAIEWGCEWVTFDRDYARFPELKWSVPGPTA